MQVHTVDQTVLPGTIAKSFVGQSFASPLCPPAVLQVLPIYMVHVTVNSRVKSLRPLETGGSGGITHTHTPTRTPTHTQTHTHMCARLLRCTSKHIYCSYAFIPPKLWIYFFILHCVCFCLVWPCHERVAWILQVPICGPTEDCGMEYSFGTDGVFACQPGKAEGHVFRESVPLGSVRRGEMEAQVRASSTAPSYARNQYRIGRRNCQTWTYDICFRLGLHMPWGFKTLHLAKLFLFLLAVIIMVMVSLQASMIWAIPMVGSKIIRSCAIFVCTVIEPLNGIFIVTIPCTNPWMTHIDILFPYKPVLHIIEIGHRSIPFSSVDKHVSPSKGSSGFSSAFCNASLAKKPQRAASSLSVRAVRLSNSNLLPLVLNTPPSPPPKY